MREIGAGEFKAQCLALIDEVAETGEAVIVTKRGKALAKLVPIVQRPKELFGFMRGSVTITDENDDLSRDPEEEKDEDDRFDRIVAAVNSNS
jgi:prevent-host-death family protein